MTSITTEVDSIWLVFSLSLNRELFQALVSIVTVVVALAFCLVGTDEQVSIAFYYAAVSESLITAENTVYVSDFILVIPLTKVKKVLELCLA